MIDLKIEKPRFPKASDDLLKKCDDWWNNAILNITPYKWGAYILGYKEAADKLVQGICNERTDQDLLVYPIVFLYRQFIELSFKELIRIGNSLLNINEDYPHSHDLSLLWAKSKVILKKLFPDDKQNISNIDKIVKQFSEIDPKSMAFRYPEDRKGNKSIHGIDQINLRNLSEIMSGINSYIIGTTAYIEEMLSVKSDINL